MIHREYYPNGELKCEGSMLEITDCTSRGSGRQIEYDDHKDCVECIYGTKFRKTSTWKYFSKKGNLIVTGNYAVLDYIGVPQVKDGIWSIYREDGRLFQQIAFNEGKVNDISIFDDVNQLIK